MKKKVFVIAGVSVLVLVILVNMAINVRESYLKRKNADTPDEILELYESNEVYSFEDILKKENFGVFQMITLLPGEVLKENNPFAGPKLKDSDMYYFTEETQINQIVDILLDYEYIVLQNEFWREDADRYGTFYLKGQYGIQLSVTLFGYGEGEKCIVLFDVADNYQFFSIENKWFGKYSFRGFVTDKQLVYELAESFQEMAQTVSVDEVRELIQKEGAPVKLEHLLCYEHIFIETVLMEGYDVYQFPLKDSEDYLSVIVMNTVISGTVGDGKEPRAYRYAVEIELMDPDGNEKETIFSDWDRFYTDREGD